MLVLAGPVGGNHLAEKVRSKSPHQTKRYRAIKNKRKKRDGTVEITYHPGIYVNEHTTRKHIGQPDECYYICFRHQKKLRWEKIGWSSEGYIPVYAETIRAEQIPTKRHGDELPKRKEPAPFFKFVAKRYIPDIQWMKHNQKGTLTDQN